LTYSGTKRSLLGIAKSGIKLYGDLSPWPEDEGSNADDLEDAPSKSRTRLQKYHMHAAKNDLWNLQCWS
jgi:hypothetical protein